MERQKLNIANLNEIKSQYGTTLLRKPYVENATRHHIPPPGKTMQITRNVHPFQLYASTWDTDKSILPLPNNRLPHSWRTLNQLGLPYTIAVISGGLKSCIDFATAFFKDEKQLFVVYSSKEDAFSSYDSSFFKPQTKKNEKNEDVNVDNGNCFICALPEDSIGYQEFLANSTVTSPDSFGTIQSAFVINKKDVSPPSPTSPTFFYISMGILVLGVLFTILKSRV